MLLYHSTTVLNLEKIYLSDKIKPAIQAKNIYFHLKYIFFYTMPDNKIYSNRTNRFLF